VKIYHSRACSAEVNNAQRYTSNPPIRLHSDKYTFTVTRVPSTLGLKELITQFESFAPSGLHDLPVRP